MDILTMIGHSKIFGTFIYMYMYVSNANISNALYSFASSLLKLNFTLNEAHNIKT